MALTNFTWVPLHPPPPELSLSSAWGCWSLPQLCPVSAGPPLEWELILWVDFLSWLQTCLIAMILPYDLDSWLDLATISRAALLALLGYWGMRPGWSSPCLARYGMPSAPGSPLLWELCWSSCYLTHWTEPTSPNKEGGTATGVEHAVREMQEVILCTLSLPFLKRLAAFLQSKAGKPLCLPVCL